MSGAKITKRTDPARTKLAEKGDLWILSAQYEARQARNVNKMRYVRCELGRMAESIKSQVVQDKKYIARCEDIKRNLAGNDENFKLECKMIVDCLVVDAAIQCRVEKGIEKVDRLAVTKYFDAAYAKLYGNFR